MAFKQLTKDEAKEELKKLVEKFSKISKEKLDSMP